MKRGYIITASVLCMVLMVNMMFIDAANNSMLISVELGVDKTQIDVDEIATFTATLTGNMQQLVFLFHDGSAPYYTTSTSLNHSFPLEGKYLVTVVAIGIGGIMSQATVEVEVRNIAPNVSISIPEFAYEDEIVNLSIDTLIETENDLKNLRYSWVLGDGQTYNQSTANHSWSESGTYAVTLYLFDDQYAIAYDTAFIEIQNIPPTAHFVTDALEYPNGSIFVVEDQEITFNASLSTDTPSDRTDLRYYWNFGDGTVMRGMVVSHAYSTSGTYQVTFGVMDDDGSHVSKNATVIVGNSAPSIVLTDTNVTLFEGETHTFYANSTDTPTDFQLLEYEWSFGGNGWKPTHIWSDDLVGTVTAQVTDPEGLNAITFIPVQVLNFPPQVSISGASLAVNLTLRVTGTPGTQINLTIYENGINTTGTVIRYSGNPKEQAITIPATMDLLNPLRIEVAANYTIPGDRANPAWVTFTFPDQSTTTFYHVFNGMHPETWIWTLYPHGYLFQWPIYISGNIFDPGSDRITGTIYFNSQLLAELDHNPDGNYPVDVPFSVMIYATDTCKFEVFASDDDNGVDNASIQITNVGGKLQFENFAPKVAIYNSKTTIEDVETSFYSEVYDYGGASLTYTWNFGDGVYSYEGNTTHTFAQAGTYLVTLQVFDGTYTTARGFVVQVENAEPVARIYGVFDGAEDQIMEFEALTPNSYYAQEELRYHWSFGDGTTNYNTITSHAYATEDVYLLRLRVVDDFGFISEAMQPIQIINLPPSIDGVTGFNNMEGLTTVMDVPVHDSVLDEQALQYTWLLESESSHSRRLAVWRDDGEYNATFSVRDPDGELSSENINLLIFNNPPLCFSAGKVLYGAPQNLDLIVFGIDSFTDMEDLKYDWTLENASIADGQGLTSTISSFFSTTKIYYGTVTVTDDSEMKYTAKLAVQAVMDTDGDGLFDEQEAILQISPNASDTDGDYITDWYEFEIYHTNPFNPDTDQDGLMDGLDTTMGCGELTLGTDPKNNDTDGDGLLDGFEVIGWYIKVNGIERPNPVKSDPLLRDTDGDNMTDFQEYNYSIYHPDDGLDPMDIDTDADGLTDWEEYWGETPPGMADTDGDKLLDSEEVTAYTVRLDNGTSWTTFSDPMKPDSDDDGLDDWEERYPGQDGETTDAMNNDTDGDGLLDSAEVYSKVFAYTTAEGKNRETVKLRWWLYPWPPGWAYDKTFEIPSVDTFAVLNATLTVRFSADLDNTMELDTRVEIGGVPIWTNHSQGTDFFCNVSDVTEAARTNFGKWELHVESSGEVLLEDFKVSVTYRLNPLEADCDNDTILDGHELNPELGSGWITSPILSDTDGDGWSDDHEIYTTGTNPLSKDRDGDRAIDPIDFDPFHNIVVRITLEEFFDKKVTFVKSHTVGIHVAQGSEESHWATLVQWKLPEASDKRLIIWNDDYYFDVDDGIHWYEIRVTGWRWGLFFDYLIVRSEYTRVNYSFADTDVQFSTPRGDHIKLTCAITSLSRVHTIAINHNGSFYNGHYPQTERFTVLMLDVNSTSGPFQQGLNVILIPVSLFVETKLHSLIEQWEMEDGTQNELPACLHGAEFYGLDRETEFISEYVECTITLGEDGSISFENASAILDLLLQNATGEVIPEYLLYEGDPSTMGIAEDVLRLIPWVASQSGPTSTDLPTAWWMWLIGIFLFGFNPFTISGGTFWNGLIAVGNFLLALGALIISWGLQFLAWLVAAFVAVIEAAVKALVLIFFLLLLALTILALIIMNVFLGLIFLVFMLLIGGTVHITPLSLGLELNGSTFWLEGIFSWEYSILFDLTLPSLTIQFRADETIIASTAISLSGSTQQSTNQNSGINDESFSPTNSNSLGYSYIVNTKNSRNSNQNEPPANRTLLLVHGHSGISTEFSDFLTNTNITEYYNNTVSVDYRGNNNYTGYGLNKGFDINTPIEDIGDALAQYIIDHPETFHEVIDIVTHSMGGLVVRSMIKYNYTELADAGYQIDDVALIAAPNHGTYAVDPPFFLIALFVVFLIFIYYISRTVVFFLALVILSLLIIIIILGQKIVGGYQGTQMSSVFQSDFLKNLNADDETPFGIDDVNAEFQDITWSTFRGNGMSGGDLAWGWFLIFLVNPYTLKIEGNDGLVQCGSVPLSGAMNYGPYSRNHGELLFINNSFGDTFFEDLFGELSTIRS